MFIVSGAKIHLFLPTILYILTIHLYFLPFAHFLLFTLHFLFLFVLQSKDFIVFLQKNQTTYQMKRNKKTFYTLLYIAGIISIWLLPLQAFGSIKLDGKRLSAKDGLSCNTVNDIIQDRDGFIWLGTPNGMSRYDGYQFINFTNFDYPHILNAMYQYYLEGIDKTWRPMTSINQLMEFRKINTV